MSNLEMQMATTGLLRGLSCLNNQMRILNTCKFTTSERFSKFRLTSFGVQSIAFALIQELLSLKIFSCDGIDMMFSRLLYSKSRNKHDLVKKTELLFPEKFAFLALLG